ncbi:lysophospholipase [Coniochaeta sp. PMI_546]|nr:lysophospholipase [Coniochaeta sp. PMI_546]
MMLLHVLILASISPIRPATALSPQETAWLELRGNNTLPALVDILERANVTDIDVKSYIQSIVESGSMVPRIGIAVSGGGYRALMNGAGALAAFDNRTANATGPGQLGGLLQAATYLAGLSGGSWLVGSLFVQNFTSVESIIHAKEGFLSQLWQFNETIIEGPEGNDQYYRELHDAVKAKADTGYNTTITDYWGRALSYQLFNASDGDPGYTFSSIATVTEFAAGLTPMPIVVAIERPSGQLLIWENSTIFEFTPWEMGSYDVGNPAFAPLNYIGSGFRNGSLPQDGNCTAGVDNVGFVVGTSSSLFNQAFLQIGKAENVPDFLLQSINATLASVGEENRDIASWPNPFYKYNLDYSLNANSTTLTLVDGGEDLQNIPLQPLTLLQRDVDVILAIDSSADTASLWPNGTSLVATQHRSASGYSINNTAFPSVPDQNTFVNLGLNRRPTFFGCYIRNLSHPSPLIVYLPNAPYTFYSNVSTFDLQYSNEERDDIIQNGYNVVTMANSSVDSRWPTCLACAILLRSFQRTQTQLPPSCEDCFNSFCWNGTFNSTAPSPYEPTQVVIPSNAERITLLPMTFYFIISLYLIMFLS